MNKPILNIIINAIMFICLMAVAGIGFLMKFVLIPGQERWVKYGGNVELSLFGLDRHEWGTIHLTLSFVLLALLMFHIILHWNIILCTCKKIIYKTKIRIIVVSSFIILCLFLTISPFFVRPVMSEINRGNGRQTANNKSIMDRGLINSDQSKFEVDQKEYHLRKYRNMREAPKRSIKENWQNNERNRKNYGRRGQMNRKYMNNR